MMTQLVQIDPANRKQVNSFLNTPQLIYAHNQYWVPPLLMEARRVFNQRKFSFYEHGTAAFFMAIDGNTPVGRLAVIDNQAYNDFNHEKTAFFYYFECIDDKSVATDLFKAGFDWAQSRGLDRLVGPKGFSVLDGMGLLVKGFELRPAFGIPYNLPYYQALIEAAGFERLSDTVSGYLSSDTVLPEKVNRLADLLKAKRDFRVQDLYSRADLKKALVFLRQMYNDALEGTEGNMPLSDADMASMSQGLLWIANPRLIKLIFKGDEPAGFLLAYPDISAALQRNNGRLFPFGWLDILFERYRTDWVNINGAGIVAKYRRMGATAILFTEMHKSNTSGRYKHADIVQIGTENEQMQLELSQLGIEFYKMHRIYQRFL
jgi:hypothetical protein